MLAFFVASSLLLSVLGILQLDTYPFSNALIVGFAVFGGSLFGKVVGAQRRTVAFLSILTLVSALDIASFLTGAQNASTSGPSSFQSVATLYANFTILFGGGSHFILGSLDLLILSFAATFFLLKGFGKWQVLLFSIVSLQLPFLYVLAFQPSDGLPLIPFITACAMALLLLERTTHVCKRVSREIQPKYFSRKEAVLLDEKRGTSRESRSAYIVLLLRRCGRAQGKDMKRSYCTTHHSLQI